MKIKKREKKMSNFRNSFLRFINSISDKDLGYLSIFAFYTLLIITIIVVFEIISLPFHTSLLTKTIAFFVPVLVFLVFLMLIPFGMLILIVALQDLIKRGKIKVEGD